MPSFSTTAYEAAAACSDVLDFAEARDQDAVEMALMLGMGFTALQAHTSDRTIHGWMRLLLDSEHIYLWSPDEQWLSFPLLPLKCAFGRGYWH